MTGHDGPEYTGIQRLFQRVQPEVCRMELLTRQPTMRRETAAGPKFLLDPSDELGSASVRLKYSWALSTWVTICQWPFCQGRKRQHLALLDLVAH